MICTYQDYADEVEMDTSEEQKSEQVAAAAAAAGEGSDQTVFPIKLHDMLSRVEREGLSHVVSWAPHGRCFLVHKKEEFVSKILTTWFRQSKFASFQRQLNLYGFKRITTGPDKNAYYHELFLRGKKFLCSRIGRIKIKGSKPGRIKSYADAEPDFYRMRAMPAEDEGGGGATTAPGEAAAYVGGSHQPILPRQDGAAEERDAPSPHAQSRREVGQGSSAEPIEPRGLAPLAPSTGLAGMNSSQALGSQIGLSFIANAPAPFPVSRSTPPIESSNAQTASEELQKKQQQEHAQFSNNQQYQQHLQQNVHEQSGQQQQYLLERGNMQLFGNSHMMQQHIAETSLAQNLANIANVKHDDEHPMSGRSAFHILPQAMAAPSPGISAFDPTGLLGNNLHPNLEASGRSNLVSLRGSNSGIFGQPGSILYTNLQQQHDGTSTMLQGPQNLSVPQQHEQFHRINSFPMDMMNLPNDYLSQHLPTAEALTVEGLFESDSNDSMEAATSTILASSPSTLRAAELELASAGPPQAGQESEPTFYFPQHNEASFAASASNQGETDGDTNRRGSEQEKGEEMDSQQEQPRQQLKQPRIFPA